MHSTGLVYSQPLPTVSKAYTSDKTMGCTCNFPSTIPAPT